MWFQVGWMGLPAAFIAFGSLEAQRFFRPLQTTVMSAVQKTLILVSFIEKSVPTTAS
jgi:hypothetical protein